MTSIEKFKSLQLPRLDMLISERLAALTIIQQKIESMDPKVAESLCNDLLMPAIYSLTEFLEAVEVTTGELK